MITHSYVDADGWTVSPRSIWTRMLEVGQVPGSKPKREVPNIDNLPPWVKETVDLIDREKGEERYFCPYCGFQVIMPFQAEIKLHSDGSMSVGLRNHLVEQYFDPLDMDVHDSDFCDTIACPFHPDKRLVSTAYKRGA